MEEVEVGNQDFIKPFSFEGQVKIEEVKFFNTKNTLQIYNIVGGIQTKPEDIVNLILQVYPQLIQFAKNENIKKSVCAKIVHNGETIVQCLNCRMDESCIICLDCFKNGDHTGHKILYKKAYGGCCDCGDAQAWDASGFCKFHSGENQDIEIETSTVTKFCQILQDIFYLYYRFKLRRENQKKELTLFLAITTILEKLIAQGPKGIKLIALFLQSPISKDLKFNQHLQNETILKHIFTYRFISRDFRKWQNIFIKMFPYYQFKKRLLAVYIECFPDLYICEQACMAGQSLSCQILTSYKLVEDYIDSHNSEPICFNAKNITNVQHMNYVSSMLFTDLQKISKLQEPVPVKYMKLQAEKGISNIFSFHILNLHFWKKQKNIVQKVNLKKSKKKNKNLTGADCQNQEFKDKKAFFNPISYMIKNIRYSSNQYAALSAFNILLRTISDDQNSLFKILRECSKAIDVDYDDLVIFRPHDRAFSLTLFTLCKQNLQNILELQFREKIINVIGKNEDEFEQWLKNLQQRMLKTYFFNAHIICNQNRGYHSSFFHYIYIYRKDNFLSSIDTVLIKMIALLSKNPSSLEFQKLLRFQDLDQQKWNIYILRTMFQQLQLIYVGKFPEICLSYYDLSERYSSPLKNDAINYLTKFIAGQGNSVTLERANKFCKTFLFDDSNLLKKYLSQCCIYLKDKKVFQLKQIYRNQKLFNFEDFELRLRDDKFRNKKIEQSQYELTTDLIKGYNRVILQYYWNFSNAQKIKQILISLHQQLSKNPVPQNLIDLTTIICKFCYNIRNIGKHDQLLIADQLLIRTPIPPQIRQKLPQYKDILGNEEILPEEKLLDKKQLLRLKKLKKMDQIRKKNQENMTAIRQVHQIEEEKQQNEENCAICRKKQSPKQQLVYLANLSIVNLQKLSNGGAGVQTISFTTCYHIFDSQCLQKQSKNEYEATLKCPICRKKGNIMFPAYPLFNQSKNHPLIANFIEKITQIMMTLHNFASIDPVSELFKSFYHYVLLAQFEPEYVKKNRIRLYKIILEIFMHKHAKTLLPGLINKFINCEMAMNSKLLKSDKIKIVNIKQGQDSYSDSEQDQSQEQSENLVMISYSRKRSNKKGVENTKQSKNIEIPNILKYVGLRIFKFIQQNTGANNKQQQSQNKQQKSIAQAYKLIQLAIMPEVPAQVQLIIDQLFGYPSKMKQFEFKRLKIQFIKLPQSFYWDMAQNICQSCKSTCHDIFICLFCKWKGCLDCKSGGGGGVSSHNRTAHGEISAFIRINDGIIYLVGNKSIRKAGCLYLNEWGEQLKLKNDWNSYFIQYDVLQKAKLMLLTEE